MQEINKLSFYIPPIFTQFSNLIAGESTRHGGVSEIPFSSLNLGINTNDDSKNVTENRRIFFEKLGISETQFASSYQVHGDKIQVVTEAGRAEGYDALITNQPNVFVGVTVADCTPILIYDALNNAVGAVHAGWRGTVAQIVLKTLQTMQLTYSTKPADCYAYVGTCIDECSFEVGEEVAEQFDGEFKRFDSALGKYLIDLKRANAAQLAAFGIPASQIEISPYSTVTHNEDYFSYRLEKGQTGRMLAVIGIKQCG
ncbi:peptidoglycan editing factor PgeF [Runella sp.]|jgi:YfiH family protein|uniref:peptidoglycan editing factor PgeF n=1 Tax=Runella sp. TaxID=1960881 RepID=UPI00260C4285|nr:peptidoglycan editing factor PgeF [Runella sp.]